MDESTPPADSAARRASWPLWLAALLVAGEALGLGGVREPPSAVLRAFFARGEPFLAAALLGSFAQHMLAPGPGGRRLGLGLGLLAEVLLLSARARGELPPGEILLNLGGGLGLGALTALALRALRGPAAARAQARRALGRALCLPGFVVASHMLLQLTVLLHPRTLDPVLYAADAGLGGQLSFAAGRLFAAAPALRVACTAVYFALPLPLSLLLVADGAAAPGAARGAAAPGAAGDPLRPILLLGAAGFVLYHALPVVGPVYFFPREFPHAPPPPGSLGAVAALAAPVYRNCVPSLHTAWALLLVLRARGRGWPLGAAALAWFTLTLLATLGLGLHYAVDLVIAVPFTIAVEGLCRRAPRPALGGALLTAGWLLALRAGAPGLSAPPLGALLAAGTLLACVPLLRGLLRRADAAAAGPAPAANAADGSAPDAAAATPAPAGALAPSAPAPPAAPAPPLSVAALFVLSGLAGLVYEVTFARSLALTFGSTHVAATTVLVVYLGGLAGGAWLASRLGEGRLSALRRYALCEGFVALSCALSDPLLGAIQRLYVAAATGARPDAPWLVALQLALGAAPLLPPTLAMGMTTPILVGHLLLRRGELGRAVSLLYVANTAGAALGALVTGYALLPLLGARGAVRLAAALNLGAALGALRLERADRAVVAAAPVAVVAAPPRPPAERRLGLLVLLCLGAVTLSLEVTSFHLLGVVAGNSTYAFALMLTSFLVGLALGGAAGRRALPFGAAALPVLLAGFAATLLCLTFAWDGVPAYFATFDGYRAARGFPERELVRGVVCALLLVPPALWIGAAYPVAMACAAGDAAGVGRGAALNTLGNIAGATVTTFLLLPRLGGLSCLRLCAGVAIALGLLGALLVSPRRPALPPLLLALACLALGPRALDAASLASGANVYFFAQPRGRVIESRESVSGGLTQVTLEHKAGGRAVRTLLTNGKFQGDDGDETPAQHAVALCPLLHTAARGRALVIGYGTGASAQTLLDAGYGALDIAELSGDVLDLAARHLPHIGGDALRRPGATSYVTDGRNFLLLQPGRYDLISMEVSSIWFAGAASLYNREFYTIARRRLAPGGVLQQWVQLHRLSMDDIASILASARAEFPELWLYFVGTQGILIACDGCAPTAAAARALAARPALAAPLAAAGGLEALLGPALLLDPGGVARLLRAASGDERGAPLVSTDDNLRLEFSTPRANVRPYGPSLRANLDMLRGYGPVRARP